MKSFWTGWADKRALQCGLLIVTALAAHGARGADAADMGTDAKLTAPNAFTLTAAAGQMQYRARETTTSGGVLNTETGSLPTLALGAKWQHGDGFVQAQTLLARQDVAYQGYTQMGIPLQTRSDIALSQLALRGGVNGAAGAGYGWGLFSGWEHLQIDRQIRPALGSLGLRETLDLSRVIAGASLGSGGHATTGFSWKASANARWAVRSRLKVDSLGEYDTVVLQPGRGTDWCLEAVAAYRWSNQLAATLQLQHELLKPGASAQAVWTRQGVPVTGVAYPGSRQKLSTLQLGLSWHF